MKNILVVPLLCILSVNFLSGQEKETRQYVFDYLIEYDLTLLKDSLKVKDHPRKSKNYYLTNSRNNGFFALVTELDSLNYRMYFKGENGAHAIINFPKSELDRAEFINIECRDIKYFKDTPKRQIKNHEFSKLSDTLIGDKTYGRYKLASLKPKRAKRLGLVSQFYVVNPETRFHLPLLTFCTAYEKWKNNKELLPNGIFQEKHFIDYYGDLGRSEKLVGFRKIDKKIVVKAECNNRKRFPRKVTFITF